MTASPFLPSSAPTICGELVVWKVAARPILAAMAFAMSMWNPTAGWVAGSIGYCGGVVGPVSKVSVPGRTRLVGDVIFGGVGLVMARGDAEGVALAKPGLGMTQLPSVRASRVLSARRPTDARVISPLPRPGGVMVLAKISDPILRRRRSRGTSAAGGFIISHWCRWGT